MSTGSGPNYRFGLWVPVSPWDTLNACGHPQLHDQKNEVHKDTHMFLQTKPLRHFALVGLAVHVWNWIYLWVSSMAWKRNFHDVAHADIERTRRCCRMELIWLFPISEVVYCEHPLCFTFCRKFLLSSSCFVCGETLKLLTSSGFWILDIFRPFSATLLFHLRTSPTLFKLELGTWCSPSSGTVVIVLDTTF